MVCIEKVKWCQQQAWFLANKVALFLMLWFDLIGRQVIFATLSWVAKKSSKFIKKIFCGLNSWFFHVGQLRRKREIIAFLSDILPLFAIIEPTVDLYLDTITLSVNVFLSLPLVRLVFSPNSWKDPKHGTGIAKWPSQLNTKCNLIQIM